MSPSLARFAAAATVAAFTALSCPIVVAQVPSALLREGDPLPAAGAGHSIEFLNNAAVNGVGGWSVGLSSTDGVTDLSHYFGNMTGGPGAILRTETTIGNYQQTSFESFYGLSDTGIGYGTTSNDIVNLVSGLDQVWIDATLVASELDPIPSLPGKEYRFNSRPSITRNGTLVWVGGIDDIVSGTQEGNGLFSSTGGAVLKTGDLVPGLPSAISSGGIDFDFRFSGQGSNYICPLDTNAVTSADFFLVVNGAGLTTMTGSLVGEGQTVPYRCNGLAGELWASFDNMGINEAGHTMFTGDTGAATTVDEFVARNNVIIYREGDVVDGETLTGAIESAAMNENGDIAYVWDVVNGLSSLEALFLNDKLILKEGDPVDFTGDGVIDGADGIATAVDFTGIASLAVDDARTMYTTVDCDIAGTSSTLDDVEVFMQITEPCGGVRRYGRGCAGSGGFEPRLTFDGCVTIGGTPTLTMSGGLGGATALLFVGSTQDAVPVGGGCSYNLAPAIFAPVAFPLGGAGAGNGSISFPVAIDPLLSPVTFTMQGWVLDPGSPIGGSATDGLEIDVIP